MALFRPFGKRGNLDRALGDSDSTCPDGNYSRFLFYLPPIDGADDRGCSRSPSASVLDVVRYGWDGMKHRTQPV
jgi:hypothetical protein